MSKVLLSNHKIIIKTDTPSFSWSQGKTNKNAVHLQDVSTFTSTFLITSKSYQTKLQFCFHEKRKQIKCDVKIDYFSWHYL